MTTLRITSSGTHEVTVIAPVGDVDGTSAKRLADAIAKADGRDVIVDLRGVESIDSIGLSVLTRAADATRGSLQVIPGPECIDRLFDLRRTSPRIAFVGDTVIDAPVAELWLG